MTTAHMPALCLKRDTAPKLGLRSNGLISFAVLCDAERKEIFLAITANDSGGYFSKEAVPFGQIEQCITPDKPIPAKAFQTAFLGRSANNGGFLAAVLKHLGLISPTAEPTQLYQATGDWAAWQAAMLAEPGEVYVPPIKDTAMNPVATISGPDDFTMTETQGQRAPRKSAGGKRHHPTGGENHDDHPT